MIWAGVCLGIALWLLDCFVDALIFENNSISQQLFSPELDEFVFRITLFVLALGLGLYADHNLGKVSRPGRGKNDTSVACLP
jgi:hypothetical protein